MNRRHIHSFCLLCGAAGLISVGFIHGMENRAWLHLSLGLVGIAWASILAMPYAILAGALPPEKTGVYMGIFNFFIVLPEIAAALCFRQADGQRPAQQPGRRRHARRRSSAPRRLLVHFVREVAGRHRATGTGRRRGGHAAHHDPAGEPAGLGVIETMARFLLCAIAAFFCLMSPVLDGQRRCDREFFGRQRAIANRLQLPAISLTGAHAFSSRCGSAQKPGSAVVPFGENFEGSTVFLPFQANRLYLVQIGTESVKRSSSGRWENWKWSDRAEDKELELNVGAGRSAQFACRWPALGKTLQIVDLLEGLYAECELGPAFRSARSIRRVRGRRQIHPALLRSRFGRERRARRESARPSRPGHSPAAHLSAFCQAVRQRQRNPAAERHPGGKRRRQIQRHQRRRTRFAAEAWVFASLADRSFATGDRDRPFRHRATGGRSRPAQGNRGQPLRDQGLLRCLLPITRSIRRSA